MSELFKPDTEPIEDLKIKREWIAEIAPALNEVIKELGPVIESGEYDTFIGEDASGRIPAIIIWQAAKEISEWNGSSQPDLRFIAGNANVGHMPPEKLEGVKALLQKTDSAKKKLIITEFVFSGNSMKTMLDIIKEAGFNADVVVVRSDYMNKQDLEKRLGCKVYLGEVGPQPGIYKAPFSGVKKEPERLFSSKRKPYEVTQSEINEARTESLDLGSYLADSYVKNKQQEGLETASNFKNPL